MSHQHSITWCKLRAWPFPSGEPHPAYQPGVRPRPSNMRCRIKSLPWMCEQSLGKRPCTDDWKPPLCSRDLSVLKIQSLPGPEHKLSCTPVSRTASTALGRAQLHTLRNTVSWGDTAFWFETHSSDRIRDRKLFLSSACVCKLSCWWAVSRPG